MRGASLLFCLSAACFVVGPASCRARRRTASPSGSSFFAGSISFSHSFPSSSRRGRSPARPASASSPRRALSRPAPAACPALPATTAVIAFPPASSSSTAGAFCPSTSTSVALDELSILRCSRSALGSSAPSGRPPCGCRPPPFPGLEFLEHVQDLPVRDHIPFLVLLLLDRRRSTGTS